MTMTSIDNLPLHQLYKNLDWVIEERRLVRKYRNVPLGYLLEEYLQELDEAETALRNRIEELSIVEEDYSEEL